jgi:hypothetical protein
MKSEWRSGSMLDLEELKVRVVYIGWTPQIKTGCVFNLQGRYYGIVAKGAIMMGSLYTLTGALLDIEMNVTPG